MRRVVVTTGALLVLGGLGVAASASSAPVARSVVVERVIDGDTFVAVGGGRVRLLTIDAPELRERTRADDADCGATRARDELAALLPVGSTVLVAPPPGEPRTDRYGRTLATVGAGPSGAVNVALTMVETGWARVYREYRTVETDRALALERAARDSRRGIWGACP